MLRFEPFKQKGMAKAMAIKGVRNSGTVVAFLYSRKRVRINERVTLYAAELRQIADKLDQLNAGEGQV